MGGMSRHVYVWIILDPCSGWVCWHLQVVLMPRADYWRDLGKTAPSLSPNKSSLSYDLEHIVRTFHSEELYPCLESRTTDQRYPQEPSWSERPRSKSHSLEAATGPRQSPRGTLFGGIELFEECILSLYGVHCTFIDASFLSTFFEVWTCKLAWTSGRALQVC